MNYQDYVREVPPTNWAPDAPNRLESWQAMVERPKSQPNDTEYARPISFRQWLFDNHPQSWFKHVYLFDNAPPSKQFLKHRRGVYRCYNAIKVHSSEFSRIYPWLRIVCGKIIDRLPSGSIKWADIVLTNRLQITASTPKGKKILAALWQILKGRDEN